MPLHSYWKKKPQRKPWKPRVYVNVQLRRAELEEREQRFEERLRPPLSKGTASDALSTHGG